MRAVHCPDAHDRGRALCGAKQPTLAKRVEEVTCKTCRSWPQLIEQAFQLPLFGEPSKFERALRFEQVHEVAAAIAETHGVSVDELSTKSRRRPVARARAAFMVALRNLDWKLERIGKLLHRDHSTVLFQIQAAADPTYRERRKARAA